MRMSPKRTRKFSTELKTTTLKGKREYQRQWAREYRKRKREDFVVKGLAYDSLTAFNRGEIDATEFKLILDYFKAFENGVPFNQFRRQVGLLLEHKKEEKKRKAEQQRWKREATAVQKAIPLLEVEEVDVLPPTKLTVNVQYGRKKK